MESHASHSIVPPQTGQGTVPEIFPGENMLALARAGAHVLPACPGFYHRPETVSGLVDFVASRALSCIGVDAGVLPRWGEGKEE